MDYQGVLNIDFWISKLSILVDFSLFDYFIIAVTIVSIIDETDTENVTSNVFEEINHNDQINEKVEIENNKNYDSYKNLKIDTLDVESFSSNVLASLKQENNTQTIEHISTANKFKEENETADLFGEE